MHKRCDSNVSKGLIERDGVVVRLDERVRGVDELVDEGGGFGVERGRLGGLVGFFGGPD